jgi:hypothetical protein
VGGAEIRKSGLPYSQPARYQLSYTASSLSHVAPFALIGTSKKIWINRKLFVWHCLVFITDDKNLQIKIGVFYDQIRKDLCMPLQFIDVRVE